MASRYRYVPNTLGGSVYDDLVLLLHAFTKGLSSEDLKLVIQAKDKVEADRQAGFCPPCVPLYFLVVCDVAISEAEAAQCG